MAIRLKPSRLLPPAYACYYLTGDDEDAVFEAAEAIIGHEAEGAAIVRADVDELSRIAEQMSPGLFGARACHALVRNAAAAKPKQIEQLERWIARPPEGLRLVLCAAGIEPRKAMHKRMTALDGLAWCDFPRMDEKAFARWLAGLAREAGLRVSDAALAMMAERLCGMRMAARQAVARLALYDGGAGRELDVDVVGELLGERAPRDLDALCEAVGERSPRAVGILRGLLREGGVSELQVLAWLATRLQQLLLYAWHAAGDARNAASRARLFGAARAQVPRQARLWRGAELMRAMQWLAETEASIKGGGIEPPDVALERLVLRLVAGDATGGGNGTGR